MEKITKKLPTRIEFYSRTSISRRLAWGKMEEQKWITTCNIIKIILLTKNE